MNIEARIVDAYLDGRLRIPGPVIQALLSAYLKIYYRIEPLLGLQASFAPPESDEIAARSQELMDAHYNMPLPMFEALLGASMKYSMALWESGAGSLDEAQEAMLDDLCSKADIADGQRILDIGCGFGSFAAHVLRRYPSAKVYGLTLSQTQADYMRAQQDESGHPLSTDRFYLIEEDFNDVDFDQPFDRVVSIGVFEHISNLDKALEKIATFLAEDGKCFLHYIVFRPRKGESDSPRQDPFIDRYVFPGGRIWAYTELPKHDRHLRVESEWYLNGANYRRTIRAWLINLLNNYDQVRTKTGFTHRQMRLWLLYLRACVAVFGTAGGRRFGNGQYLLRAA